MPMQTTGGDVLAKVPQYLIRNGEIDRRVMYTALIENRILREDETRQIEETLTRVSRRDLVAVADLRARGLTASLRNIGVTSYEFDRVTPVDPATQSMSILNLGDRDLVTFNRTAIPVPVTASQFQLDARQRAAGQTIGEGIDTTNLEEHTRAVAEKLEDTLVNGGDVSLGGNGLPGYTNFAGREQLSFSDAEWSGTLSAGFAATVIDLLAARSALRANGFTGPYIVYLPSNFDGVIDEDFKANGDRTVRERLLAINGIEDIKILPTLADSNVLMVQMTSSVVQMPVGQDITTVTWDMYGGLAMNWAVLAVLSFALKSAWAREPLSSGVLPALTTASGIAHIS